MYSPDGSIVSITSNSEFESQLLSRKVFRVWLLQFQVSEPQSQSEGFWHKFSTSDSKSFSQTSEPKEFPMNTWTFNWVNVPLKRSRSWRAYCTFLPAITEVASKRFRGSGNSAFEFQILNFTDAVENRLGCNIVWDAASSGKRSDSQTRYHRELCGKNSSISLQYRSLPRNE